MTSLWNKRQAAEFLNISPFSVSGKVSRREIPFVKIGRRCLFDPADLKTFVEAHKVDPRPRRANGGE
jgi:excisionase family DNA binding protein